MVRFVHKKDKGQGRQSRPGSEDKQHRSENERPEARDEDASGSPTSAGGGSRQGGSRRSRSSRRRSRRRRSRSGGDGGGGKQDAEATAESKAEQPVAKESPGDGGGKQQDVPAWDVSRFQVPPAEGKKRFHDFDLPADIMHAIADLQFEYCTPIQAEILPDTLAGKDAFGRAQTGTGKTAAFLITIFAHFVKHPPPDDRRPGTPRALITAPTRELAMQIERDAVGLSAHLPIKTVAVFGGMGFDQQQKALSGAVDVLVATPGRLLDFKRRRVVHLGHVEILVIDEADRMLDMGFIPDMRKIIHSTPTKTHRQTMLFSATLTPEVRRLASNWTRDPVTVEIEPEEVTVKNIDQLVYIVTSRQKFPLLYNLITREGLERVLVFANRRDQARRLTERFKRCGINADLISGEVNQKKRVRTLEEFREGKVRVLVGTDVAARGLHVEGISHVVNYTLPEDAEDYVHRIGRTGRAGAQGTSVSFASEDDAFHIPDIEEYLGRSLPCRHPEDELVHLPPGVEQKGGQRSSEGGRGGSRRSGRRRGGRRRSGSRGRGSSS